MELISKLLNFSTDFLLPFIILITVVVFIHEYGHYYFARKYKVGVTDFSIGFGRELFGWTDTYGTRWKFCLIPLGGYVKFFGDRNVFSQSEQEEVIKKYSREDQEKLFILKPLYQRSLIVAAGPLANFFLAIVIFSIINMFVGRDNTPAIISEIQKDGPTYESGILPGDKIFSINDREIESILQVSPTINSSTSDKIKIVISRNDELIVFFISPKIIESEDNLGNKFKKKIIGIKLAVLDDSFVKEKLGFTKSIFYAVKEVWFVSVTSLKYLITILSGGGDSSQLGGPIRIAQITGQVAELGIIPFISIMAYISISLGLINLFPIPMLDGGHLMFYLFEKILGRPLKQKTQEGFFRIGLFLLFFLMFFATFNDLKSLGLF